MATLTHLETITSKTSGTTLTSSSHALVPGESLIVAINSVDTAGPPTTVLHNGRTLRRRINNANATNTLHLSGWVKGEYNQNQTGVVRATWSVAIVERVMSVWKLNISINEEATAIKDETTATVTPGTGHTGALITAGSFVVGQRYEIDTPGTTDFTLIGAANSNAGTLFTATESVRSRISAYGTARTWATGILVVRARTSSLIRQGITPTDTGAVEQIVSGAGGVTEDILYGINEDTGLWEAFEVASPGTAVATRDEAGAWS